MKSSLLADNLRVVASKVLMYEHDLSKYSDGNIVFVFVFVFVSISDRYCSTTFSHSFCGIHSSCDWLVFAAYIFIGKFHSKHIKTKIMKIS